jgi:hypothetical protein
MSWDVGPDGLSTSTNPIGLVLTGSRQLPAYRGDRLSQIEVGLEARSEPVSAAAEPLRDGADVGGSLRPK